MPSNRKEHAVYKYVHNGIVIYVGKTDCNLDNRIRCHKSEEKFKKFKNADIFYTVLQNKSDTGILEAQLIRKYNPELNEVYPSPLGFRGFFEEDFDEPDDWIEYIDPKDRMVRQLLKTVENCPQLVSAFYHLGRGFQE